MVTAYAIQDFKVDVDEVSQEVILTIVGASGNKLPVESFFI